MYKLNVILIIISTFVISSVLRGYCFYFDTKSPLKKAIAVRTFSRWEKYNSTFAASIIDSVIRQDLDPASLESKKGPDYLVKTCVHPEDIKRARYDTNGKMLFQAGFPSSGISSLFFGGITNTVAEVFPITGNVHFQVDLDGLLAYQIGDNSGRIISQTANYHN